VKVRTAVIVVTLALAAAATLVVSSVGAAKPSASDFSMAIVTDIGSLQDRSFNQLANEGRIAIGKQLKIKTRAIETHSESERIPNALAACRQGYKLIFEVGFLNYTALNAVAPKCPQAQFAGIDQPYVLFSKKPANAAGVVFAEQEAGYLVGYLAGLEMKKEGGKTISTTSAGTSRVRRRPTRVSRCSRTTPTTRRSTTRPSATRRR